MNNKRKIYLDLFNLNENASLEEIKKRFRELAKEFHPDKNKENNAHDRFLIIKEAYEYLINNQINESKNLYYENINLEKERIEKIRLAKERLNNFYRRKEEKIHQDIENYFKSLKWKYFILISSISTMIALLIILDQILINKIEKTIITETSNEYESIDGDKILLVKTEENSIFFIKSKLKKTLNKTDSIKIIKSRLLNRNIKVLINDNIDRYTFININNFNSMNCLFILIFILPGTYLYFKTKTISYILAINILCTIYTPIIICFLSI